MRILGLVLMLSLGTCGVAWPKGHRIHRPRLHSAHHRSTHVRRPRHLPMHHRSRLAALAAAPSPHANPVDPARFHQAASGPSEHPGLFKGPHEAGWGFRNDRMTTVVGLYQRPEQPDGPGLPANQVYHHDIRGAAGLSLSFKLAR